ncbi:MAG: hypothetical protein AAB527_00645 [Patescibacteria group bacterium]
MAEQNQIENERALNLAESRKDEGASFAETNASSNRRIEMTEGGLMTGFAFCAFLVGLIPFLGTITSGATWFIIYMWAKTRGLQYPPQYMLGGGAGGLIPFVPAHVALVWFIILYNNNPGFKAYFGKNV